MLCLYIINSVTEVTDVESIQKINQLGLRFSTLIFAIRRPYDLTAITSASDEVISSLQLGSQFRVMTKSHVWWTDDPWAAFVAIGGIVIVLALVGLLVLRRSYVK